ncbi:MAG: hypothetical protein ABJJ37_11815 [Roseibium sp.]
MKTLMGLTTERILGRKGQTVRRASAFKVIEFEHSQKLDLPQDLQSILASEKPVTTVTHLQNDRRDISEIILTHLIERQCSGIVEHFAFDPQVGAFKTGSGLDNSGLGIAVTFAGDIPLHRKGQSADFFDLLRDLDTTLAELSENLRGINDPALKDARVKQVEAAIKCLRIYTNADIDDGPDTIPGNVVRNAKDGLNWDGLNKLGDGIANLATAAAKLLEAINNWVSRTPN